MKTNRSVKVIVLHENPSHAARVTELLNRVGAELHFERREWDFDALSDPGERAQAAAAAARADIIVVAARSAVDLPEEVKQCVARLGFVDRISQAALVALFEDETAVDLDTTFPAYDYLRRVARQANIAFFCNLADWERDREESQSRAVSVDYSWQTAREYAFYEPAARGWGIND